MKTDGLEGEMGNWEMNELDGQAFFLHGMMVFAKEMEPSRLCAVLGATKKSVCLVPYLQLYGCIYVCMN